MQGPHIHGEIVRADPARNFTNKQDGNGGAPAKRVRGPRIQLRSSDFIITINTQQRFADLDDPALHDLNGHGDAIISDMFSNQRVLEFIKITEPGRDNRWLKEITFSGTAEIGDKNNQLHWHILLAISHYTKVKLDIPKMNEELKRRFALPGIYMNVQTLYNERVKTLDRALGYIYKNH